jgi:hypothetical protein
MGKEPYRKEGRIRLFGVGGVEITVPRVIAERACRSEGQTIEEFAKTHRVVHLFNDFTDFTAAYRFEKIEPTEDIMNVEPEPEKPVISSFEGMRAKLGKMRRSSK